MRPLRNFSDEHFVERGTNGLNNTFRKVERPLRGISEQHFVEHRHS